MAQAVPSAHPQPTRERAAGSRSTGDLGPAKAARSRALWSSSRWGQAQGPLLLCHHPILPTLVPKNDSSSTATSTALSLAKHSKC